jgi:zinc/manganese transport system substrate-binding protein
VGVSITTKAAAALAAVTLAVAGCSGTNHDSSGQQAGGATTVVATTDVWGSVATAVVGDHATVKSIVNSSAEDPHSFEATPADAATIADAALVVYNGGGYDHWADDVLSQHKDVPTVDAYSLLPSDLPQPANEHVFYDLGTVKAVAKQIATKLGETDPGNASVFQANADAFAGKVDGIASAEKAIGSAHPGVAVVATEPVAHYLLVNSGIADKTPEGFANAAEQDTDPSPADLAAVLDLINSHQVSALLFNPQTETPAAKQVEDAANKASVPVVNVMETLPQGQDYLTWQRQTVDQLASQLDKAPQANR